MAINKALVSKKPAHIVCSRVGIHTCLGAQHGMRSQRIRREREQLVAIKSYWKDYHRPLCVEPNYV